MKIIRFTLPFLFLAIAAHAAEVKSDIKADIDAMNAKFGAAYAKGDAAGIAKLYTPDATILPPGSNMVVGREGIEKVWAGAMQSGMKLTGLHTVSVRSMALRRRARSATSLPKSPTRRRR